MEGIDAIIHLGGVGIGERRWTERVRQRLWDSRVQSTEVLATAAASSTFRPKTFICASAIGYYGSRGDEVLTESSPQGQGFLADLCGMWEEATSPAREAGIRVVNLRSGVVLDPNGGALAKQIPLFRSFAGGPMSRGQSWMSWVSLYDEIEAIIWALQHEHLEGPVNLTSPNPVTNLDYTIALAKALSRPNFIPTPRWLLELALGKGVANEVLLASQRAIPEKLQRSGFVFRYPDIESMLREMLAKSENDVEIDEESPEFWEMAPPSYPRPDPESVDDEHHNGNGNGNGNGGPAGLGGESGGSNEPPSGPTSGPASGPRGTV
jgi:uncharacterized protein (TIGR01777 family)